MKKLLQTLVFTVLIALTAPVWALGLGQLTLKSGPGQPLVAEIPVISSEPGELERLQARLASPETFLRVGLPLPDSLVSDLQFSVAQDSQGKPVIRVTSPGPVTIPMLTFLLEVDWGEGRLVREYSVLVAAPESVEAAAVPDIEMAEGVASNTIVRDAQSTASQSEAPAAEPISDSLPPAAPAAPAAAVVPSPMQAQGGQALQAVRRGETLSGIAAAMKQPGQDLQTIMAALLAANPQAFINGNPNRLREGAVLQMPAGDAASGGFNSAEVEAMAAQLAQWRSRSGRRGSAVDVASGVDSPAARRGRGNNANTRNGARLEITPAAASSGAGATVSGTGGRGDSSMAQQLQEAHETIAARDAEVAELKSRVAELETLKDQQSQLLQMKDGELALVQQQLKAQAESRAAADSASAGSMLLWSALGVLLLAGIVFAAWILRQRKQSNWQAAPASGAAAAAEHGSLADELEPIFDSAKGEENNKDIEPELPLSNGEVAAWDEFQDGAEKPADSGVSPANTLWHLPSWVGSASHEWEKDGQSNEGIGLKPVTDDPAKVGAWSFPADGGEPRAEGFANQAQAVLPDAVPAVPERNETQEAISLSEQTLEDGRLMLARTYIELGDYGTARLLLQQVVDEGDAEQAGQAQQLLDSLD